MKCIYCNKESILTNGVHKINYKDKIIVISNVPTLYCNSCGEQYYSAEVVDNLKKIIEIAKNYKVNDKRIIVDYVEMMKTLDEISAAV